MDPENNEVSPDVQAAWRRARNAMARLFATLADLDEAGGIDAIVDMESWSDRKSCREVERMKLLRIMLRAQIDRLRK